MGILDPAPVAQRWWVPFRVPVRPRGLVTLDSRCVSYFNFTFDANEVNGMQ